MDEIRRKLAIFFKDDHRMVDAYVESFGLHIQMRNIQVIRDRFTVIPDDHAPLGPEAATPDNAAEESASGQDPSYPLTFDCPCCRMWNLTGYELHAKSQIIQYDPFLVPLYQGHGGYRTLNFLTVAVTVCKRCLFASPDKKDFIQFTRNRKERRESQLNSFLLSEIQDTMAERMSIKEEMGIGEELFTVPRPLTAAILSYRLAEHRASIEAKNKIKFAWFKKASYWSRIALLERMSGIDDSASLEKAARSFSEAYLRTDFPGPDQEGSSCYSLFMIHLRFNRVKEARDYLGVMEKQVKDLENGEQTPDNIARRTALAKWVEKAKMKWEDREDPRIWVTPGLKQA